jgi:hypothetical protein
MIGSTSIKITRADRRSCADGFGAGGGADLGNYLFVYGTWVV